MLGMKVSYIPLSPLPSHFLLFSLVCAEGKLIVANAIPIEGWISDPTDHDLLHLIPFLRALRLVGDVRNLLGLRNSGRRL